MSMLDLATFEETPVRTDPYPFLFVRGFLKQEARQAVLADYPAILKPGSFPTSALSYGPQFSALLSELEGPDMRDAFGRKFGVDLTGRPTMVTVRGLAQGKDGRTHTDSKTKIITVLLYMNSRWEAEGGRLRILRSGDSLDNAVDEVPPDEGTLLAFLVTPHSWHGHRPFVGPRRVIQLNWVTDEGVVRQEQSRHRLSAKVKKILSFAAG